MMLDEMGNFKNWTLVASTKITTENFKEIVIFLNTSKFSSKKSFMFVLCVITPKCVMLRCKV